MLQLRVSVFSSFPCHDNMDFFFTVQRVIVADIFNCDFKKEEIALTCYIYEQSYIQQYSRTYG